MTETTEPTLTTMALTVCSLCAGGTEGECHTPGCAFWMKTAPGVPLTNEADEAGVRPREDGDVMTKYQLIEDHGDGEEPRVCGTYAIEAEARRTASSLNLMSLPTEPGDIDGPSYYVRTLAPDA
jgi:hypothetical protein